METAAAKVGVGVTSVVGAGDAMCFQPPVELSVVLTTMKYWVEALNEGTVPRLRVIPSLKTGNEDVPKS